MFFVLAFPRPTACPTESFRRGSSRRAFLLYCSETVLTFFVTSNQIFASLSSMGPTIGPEIINFSWPNDAIEKTKMFIQKNTLDMATNFIGVHQQINKKIHPLSGMDF